MVCIRNLAGLLLALAAAPSVLATPVVAREPAKGAVDPLTLLSGDSSSASGGNGASASNSPSASPTVAATTSQAVTSQAVTPTPTTGPTSISSPSNSPSQTQVSSQTSSPAPTTKIVPSTSIAIALTTLPISQGQSTFIVYQTQTTGLDGSVGTAFATQAVAAATDAASADAGKSNNDSGKSSMPVGTIVGIVVGVVGGIVLIGALAAVSWRIWGKNRHNHEEDDALMDDGVYGHSEVKGASGASNTPSPFQNNLEQYHNGKANPSANF